MDVAVKTLCIPCAIRGWRAMVAGNAVFVVVTAGGVRTKRAGDARGEGREAIARLEACATEK
jgi:hypothetical protein